MFCFTKCKQLFNLKLLSDLRCCKSSGYFSHFPYGLRTQYYQVLQVCFIHKKANLMAEEGKIKNVEGTCDAVVKHIDTPEFHSIFSVGLKKLHALFLKNGFEMRLCGGAVRDILLGKKPKDLDFASVATPDQMIAMFNKEGIRLISETGWTHGTVTCRLEEENFEITTLRIDTVCDGRRAVVEYTKDWKIDAARRDLTINSMFMTLDGYVIDYFGGIEDLKHRIVKYVGNPKQRIMEDYLRILRFFRFFGRIADDHTEFDQNTLDIISQNLGGLDNVSGERLHTELQLIFSGDHVVKVLRTMHKCGLFPFIALPSDADLDHFEKVYDRSKRLNAHYQTFVTALIPTEKDLEAYHRRVKFSNVHLNISRFILQHEGKHAENDNRFALYTDMIVEYHKKFRLKGGCNYFFEFLKYKGDEEALAHFTDFRIPQFPVSGTVVKEKTGATGKDIGKVMNMLYQLWRESEYKLTGDELAEHIDLTTLDKLKDS